MTAIENHMEAARSLGPVASESFTLRVSGGGKRWAAGPVQARHHVQVDSLAQQSRHAQQRAVLTAATPVPQRPP